MKHIFTLLAIAIVLSSCEKEQPIDEFPEEALIHFDYSVAVFDDWWSDDTCSAHIDSEYWDENGITQFRYTLVTCLPNNASPGIDEMKWVSPSQGAFNFGYVEEHVNGTKDTIYGNGYFSEDTLYIDYTYMSLEDTSEIGTVHVHSL